MPYPRHDFDINVDWEVKSEAPLVWVDKGSDLYKKTGITMYAVKRDQYNPFYTYTISIKTDDPYHYTFYDEEGDSYGLMIVAPKMSTSSHDVQYNSKKPKIVRVVGKASGLSFW